MASAAVATPTIWASLLAGSLRPVCGPYNRDHNKPSACSWPSVQGHREGLRHDAARFPKQPVAIPAAVHIVGVRLQGCVPSSLSQATQPAPRCLVAYKLPTRAGNYNTYENCIDSTVLSCPARLCDRDLPTCSSPVEYTPTLDHAKPPLIPLILANDSMKRSAIQVRSA